MPHTRSSKAGSAWNMYPDLHDRISQTIATDNLVFDFQNNDSSKGLIDSHDTNIMGRFICNNTKCSSPGWGSKKIAIFMRLYPNQRYNAQVFRQRCKSCNRLGRMILNEESYVERIAYRLKRWSDVDVERPPWGGHNGEPHEDGLCEGCKAGHCSGGRNSMWG